MRNIIYAFILCIGIIGCASINSTTDNSTIPEKSNDTIRIANDSLEYEILIIEPGFNAWLISQPPRGYYGLQYLETRNRIAVANYNARVLQPSRYDPILYVQQINYDSSIDYGYEVNYLLFNWLEFFQERYNQQLR